MKNKIAEIISNNIDHTIMFKHGQYDILPIELILKIDPGYISKIIS